MQKVVLMIIIVIALSLGGFYWFNNYIYEEKQGDPIDSTIASYEECIAAGYPKLTGYPSECETADGKHFVQNLPEDEVNAVSKPTTVEGTFICLPHWDTTGAQTLECAFGILTDEGHYYALRDLDPQVGTLGKLDTNSKIQVTGVLIPGSSPKYQTRGTIEISSTISL